MNGPKEQAPADGRTGEGLNMNQADHSVTRGDLETNHSSVLESAETYTARGWRCIPIPTRKKAPTLAGWQQPRLSAADLHKGFTSPCNVGVLLGDPSGGLVDIDLDHELAVHLADQYLPPTGAVFGRDSRPRSHRLYLAAGPTDTVRREIAGHGTIAELRSTGCQTVFPPSLHPSGEQVRWDLQREPAAVVGQDLVRALDALVGEIQRRMQALVPGNGRPEPSPTPLDNMPAPPHVVDRAGKYLETIPPAISGQSGHRVTFYAACVLTLGFSLNRDQAFKLLSVWNCSCQPPWSEKELDHKLNDALKQPGVRGYLLDPSSGGKQRTSASAKQHPANDAAVMEDPWPDPLAPEAFHGVAGEIVRAIEPHSEADLAGLLVQFLAGFGSLIGKSAHFRVEGDCHPGKLFTCLVGATSKGRKGTSWGQAARLLASVDPEWAAERVMSGLSSGEGLI